MSRWILAKDHTGDLAIWDNRNPNQPLPVLYRPYALPAQREFFEDVVKALGLEVTA